MLNLGGGKLRADNLGRCPLRKAQNAVLDGRLPEFFGDVRHGTLVMIRGCSE